MKNSTRTRKLLSNSFYSLLVSVAIVTAALYLFILSPLSDWLILLEKNLMVKLLGLLGISIVDIASNAIIAYSEQGHAITIILTPSCVGVYAVAVYMMFVLFTPNIDNRSKIKGLSVGVSVLFLANIVRILASGVLGVINGYASFRFFHDIIGGALMILLVATLWVDWVYRTSVHAGWP